MLFGLLVFIIFSNKINVMAGTIIEQKAIDRQIEKVKHIDDVIKNKKVKNQKYIPNFRTIPLYLPEENYGHRKELVTHAVIHFSSYAAITPENPYNVMDIYRTFADYGVSAHYLIDRDGEIYQMVPEDKVAYHAGKGGLVHLPEYKDKLNHYSIGIEILAIGTEEEMLPMLSRETYQKIKQTDIGYTNAQYNALSIIIDDLVARYPNMKKDRLHIVGHDEYAKGRKTDPGSLFDWTRIGF